MGKIDFPLYLITDRHQTGKRSLPAVVEDALRAGVKAVQLREKDLNARELLELALSMRNLTKDYGAKLFINDRVDIAMAVGADGVHLGQKSFFASDVKKIFSKAIVGVSAHSLKEAKKAEGGGADFITIGPIFHTPSKAEYGEPLGVEIIKKVKTEIKIPAFAIGGIKKESVRDVMQAGSDGVAVISAALGAEDVGKAVIELKTQMSNLKTITQNLKTDSCKSFEF